MTKTGRVATLNKLNSGPFVEIHPDDATALGITDGGQVELTSRRGVALMPAVVTDRVRPGNCFVPFHWNDVHGADLTINALTSDAVDPVSLQPEFKVCAVRLRAVAPAPTDRLAGQDVRHSGAVAGDGPLVLWASQTGNAEDFAARVADRLDGARLLAMNEATLDDVAARRDVVIVTSTFGDGGPPDNGADFWDRLACPDAPTLDGVRYAVLGIGDRSYAEFCGHAKSLDRRLADLGAITLVDRVECEAYDDEPMAQWADRIVELIGGRAAARVTTATQTSAKEFTRTNPLRVPLCRNVLLTPRASAKEVRQFGFDTSEYDVAYAVGDALGVYVTNAPTVVDAWLAADGSGGHRTRPGRRRRGRAA